MYIVKLFPTENEAYQAFKRDAKSNEVNYVSRSLSKIVKWPHYFYYMSSESPDKIRGYLFDKIEVYEYCLTESLQRAVLHNTSIIEWLE